VHFGEVVGDALAIAEEHLRVELPGPAVIRLTKRPARDEVDDERVLVGLRRLEVEVLDGGLEAGVGLRVAEHASANAFFRLGVGTVHG
jgi:hypothetical protein